MAACDLEKQCLEANAILAKPKECLSHFAGLCCIGFDAKRAWATAAVHGTLSLNAPYQESAALLLTMCDGTSVICEVYELLNIV